LKQKGALRGNEDGVGDVGDVGDDEPHAASSIRTVFGTGDTLRCAPKVASSSSSEEGGKI
jgi:hypothetical protein